MHFALLAVRAYVATHSAQRACTSVYIFTLCIVSLVIVSKRPVECLAALILWNYHILILMVAVTQLYVTVFAKASLVRTKIEIHFIGLAYSYTQ